MSSDFAAGVNDTKGACYLCTPIEANSSCNNPIAGYTPADTDDNLAALMAANSDRLHLVGTVPTFGNANLGSGVMSARYMLHTLAGRYNVPVHAGAAAPVQPVWTPVAACSFEGGCELGGLEVFKAVCENEGVRWMRNTLSSGPTALAVTGPWTDTACLLARYPTVAANITRIVGLNGQLVGEDYTIAGKPVGDFNTLMDPAAVAVGLSVLGANGVPVTFVTFNLSGQPQQPGGPMHMQTAELISAAQAARPTAVNAWAAEAQALRDASWAATFGTGEGPFDQLVISYLEQPSLYTCTPHAAAVVQCTSASGYEPFNAPDNACVMQGPDTSGLSNLASRASAQLQLFPLGLGDGATPPAAPALLLGEGPISTLLPALQQQPAPIVSACTDFAPGVTREQLVLALSRGLY